MFRKVAKVRPLETWRMLRGTRAAVHSNDNLRGFRHPAASRHPRPNPALACHWHLIDGHLECRWDIETPDGAPIDNSRSQSKAGRAFGRPVRLRQGNGTLLAVDAGNAIGGGS